MPMCKFCGVPFSWAQTEDGWHPLVPVGEEGELARKFQDENGNLRSSHRDICNQVGGATVRATRLAKPMEASDILSRPITDEHGEILGYGKPKKKKRGRPRKQA